MASTDILRVTFGENDIKRYPDRTTESLEILKDWLKKQPHLPYFEDDFLLLQFLRRCRYSVEKAKSKLDNYLTFRTHFPELTTNRHITNTDIQETLEMCQLVVLPKRDPNGNIVMVWRLLTSEVAKFHPAALFKLYTSFMECYIRENGTIPGYVVVVDSQKGSLAQISKFNLTLCRQVYFFLQSCCPSSIKGVYSVNSNAIMEHALKFFKSILHGRMIREIKIVQEGALEHLYQYVPRDILPEEYGGNAGPMEALQRESNELIRRGKPYIAELDKLKVNEARRTGRNFDLDSNFGITGTFRKLEVD